MLRPDPYVFVLVMHLNGPEKPTARYDAPIHDEIRAEGNSPSSLGVSRKRLDEAGLHSGAFIPDTPPPVQPEENRKEGVPDEPKEERGELSRLLGRK